MSKNQNGVTNNNALRIKIQKKCLQMKLERKEKKLLYVFVWAAVCESC